MLLNFSGPSNRIIEEAFFDEFGTLDSTNIISGSPTQIVVFNSATGITTTLTGNNFAVSGDGEPIGGTITGVAFVQSGSTQTALSSINWGVVAFVDAIDAIEISNNFAPMASLFDSSGPITIDANNATGPIDIWYLFGGITPLLTQPMIVTGTGFADHILGGSGNDSLVGNGDGTNGVEDEIDGGNGNDTLRAGGADGFLIGGQGNDLIDGGSGYDQVSYQSSASAVNVNLATGIAQDGYGTTDTLIGIEMLRGSFYSDTLIGDNLNNQFRGLAGNDTINGGGGIDRVRYDGDSGRGGLGSVWLDLEDQQATDPWGNIDTLISIEQVRATAGNDILLGNDSNNRLQGEDGLDRIDGRGGADLLEGGAGSDDIYGGDGFDTIYGGEGNDTVDGGNGRDLIYLNQGDDVYHDNTQGGDLGRDTVFAGLGNDTIYGGNGDDAFHGEVGNDLIFGRFGNDRIFGGDGFDTIHGGEGNDTVTGGNGRDLVYLNQGNDVYHDNTQGGELGRDTVFAGLGNDTIYGGNGDDAFHGEAGNDVIYARLGNDTVYGGDQFDFIDAGDGNDLVFGGYGQDRIFLGAGNDVYIDTGQSGTLGQDTITGGAGADRFEFRAVMSADVITDFQVGIDDLQLTQSLWGGGLSAAQVVSDYASVTADGVLLDFGSGRSILLQDLTSTAGLEDDILLV